MEQPLHVNPDDYTPLLSPLDSIRKSKRKESFSSLNSKRTKTPNQNPLDELFNLPEMDLQLPPPPMMPPVMHRKSQVLINHNRKSAHSSPVILPSSVSPQLFSNTPIINNLNVNGTGILSSNDNMIPLSRTNTGGSISRSGSISYSSTNTNTNTNINNSIMGGDKKMTHKLAEQGRRNRMNIAVQELESLIPERLKDNCGVPSKAGNIELGCKYIKELQSELAYWKNLAQSGTGCDDSNNSGNEKEDSISNDDKKYNDNENSNADTFSTTDRFHLDHRSGSGILDVL
ncbi:phosphate-sensing transcription factor [Martiniozyma asiatica (nom. inval.)]|nr:phosphate-sensing transcription factor [Martiniozyma asiatica]